MDNFDHVVDAARLHIKTVYLGFKNESHFHIDTVKEIFEKHDCKILTDAECLVECWKSGRWGGIGNVDINFYIEHDHFEIQLVLCCIPIKNMTDYITIHSIKEYKLTKELNIND